MKLSCLELGIDLDLKENRVNVLVIENPGLMVNFLERLCAQKNGIESGVLLYEGETKLSPTKYVEIIHSPLLLEFNSRKIITHLYQEMRSVSCDCLDVEMQEINSTIVDYLDKVASKLPYPLKFNLDMDWNNLYKQYDVQLDYSNSSLLERLINYMQLESSLCEVKIMVLINMKSYLPPEQIGELYEAAFYSKMRLVLIESTERDCLQQEKYCIIDKDKCLISYN